MSNSNPLKDSLVFQPIKVGDNTLSNRIVYCPTTRFRAAKGNEEPTYRHVPLDLMLKYYSDRAQYPGTLLVTEATLISNRAGGYDGCPKISTQEETKAWKKLLMLFIQRDHFYLVNFGFR